MVSTLEKSVSNNGHKKVLSQKETQLDTAKSYEDISVQNRYLKSVDVHGHVQNFIQKVHSLLKQSRTLQQHRQFKFLAFCAFFINSCNFAYSK